MLDALVEAAEVPLPESVVATEVETRTHDAVHAFDHDEERFAEFLAGQGQTREEFDASTLAEAEKSVRTRLVLDALADAEQVQVSDAELTERIVMQAQQYRMPPEEFVRRIQEAGQLGAIYADVRRTKALIAAVRAATVTDASGDAGRPVRPARRRTPRPRRGRDVDGARGAGTRGRRDGRRRPSPPWTPSRGRRAEHAEAAGADPDQLRPAPRNTPRANTRSVRGGPRRPPA